MDIKEYRIKNLIRWDLNNPKEDNQPEQGYIEMELMSLNSDFNRITPVPLTEDWLKRLGFKKITSSPYNDKNYYFEKYDITIKIIGNIIIFGVYDDLMSEEAQEKGRLSYVHELQNLFYKTYKTELEYV